MYPEIDKNICINCYICVDICPYEVFSGRDSVVIVERPENCIECGECIRNCESNAIKLTEG